MTDRVDNTTNGGNNLTREEMRVQAEADSLLYAQRQFEATKISQNERYELAMDKIANKRADQAIRNMNDIA
jgi:hypothetical protein